MTYLVEPSDLDNPEVDADVEVDEEVVLTASSIENEPEVA